ncbi:TolB family protein [Ammoniphilus resinae]|uniref:Uncharacterized protein n=1 Tax=Ammoniphilus resinae TaxID=861532 RepID=A0ABS4GVD0_9BACL|nr:PD40 domain-containing protein [Ammoniphilus resinae]MBP1934217.1 hypothetical protein [Ammoniphilus resinae]
MKKMLALLIAFLLLLQPISLATGFPQAAFIRNHDLWIKMGNGEIKLTDGIRAAYPKWSPDGQWIAYLSVPKDVEFAPRAGELWLYHLDSEKHTKVSPNASANFSWSPKQNVLAFQSDQDLLQTATSGQAQKIASGVINFSWLPDGTGFLTSSKAGENVYSDIVLSKFLWNQQTDRYKSHPFYTIKVGANDYFYGTSAFKWSPDRRWIAFELVPTASLSADSNTLSVISSDAKLFRKIDQMLNYENWFQWAPTVSQLGYIQGVSRLATENKKFKVFNPEQNAASEFTPAGYVDRDFDWQTDQMVVVSRSKESKGFSASERPMPSLYKLDTRTKTVMKITSPSAKEGDFRPESTGGHLLWIRTNREKANVWIASPNGLDQKIWIQNLDLGAWYYEHWDWDQVFALYRKNITAFLPVSD